MIGRRLRLVWRVALASLLILSTAQGAVAAGAQDQLKDAIDRVVRTLESPALKGADKAADRRRWACLPCPSVAGFSSQNNVLGPVLN